MVQEEITLQTLKELLDYNPETGIFTWKVKRWRELAGQEVKGSPDKGGYKTIKLFQKRYKLHRLAWFYVYGCWPQNCIDHIDGNVINNKITNLRDVTKQQNCQNIRKANKSNKFSKVLGVHLYTDKRWNITKKWVARIGINGKTKTIGYFDSIEKAKNAYIDAKRKYHAGCTI